MHTRKYNKLILLSVLLTLSLGLLVAVSAQETAENGEIVCALINEEATIKKFYREGNAITLKAENSNYAPIPVLQGEFRIVGKVVGVIRTL